MTVLRESEIRLLPGTKMVSNTRLVGSASKHTTCQTANCKLNIVERWRRCTSIVCATLRGQSPARGRACSWKSTLAKSARSWESSHVRELSVGGRSVSKQTSLNVYRKVCSSVLVSGQCGLCGAVWFSFAVYEHADPKYVMKGLFHSRCQFDVFFVMPEIDIFVSSKGNFNISTLDHMKKLKNNAFRWKHRTLGQRDRLCWLERLGMNESRQHQSP